MQPCILLIVLFAAALCLPGCMSKAERERRWAARVDAALAIEAQGNPERAYQMIVGQAGAGERTLHSAAYIVAFAVMIIGVVAFVSVFAHF